MRFERRYAGGDRKVSIYYVRHGETSWSLSGQHTGTTEVPLTERGKADAVALGAYLGGIEFSHVLCSPRQRAQQTSELLDLKTRVEIRDDIVEWHYGEYEGLRTVDIRRARPGWNIWNDGCPRGESPADISARVDRFIADLEILEGHVAVISHGHFGSALLTRWAGFPISAGQHFALDPTSLSILGRAKHEPDIHTLLLVNASPEKPASRF
jgi:probable phosphoglycerate mutase